MVRLWRMAYPGMGAGYLPEAGGVMDQSAAMMEAFALMNQTAGEMEEHSADKRQV